jgi:hypothetical protein
MNLKEKNELELRLKKVRNMMLLSADGQLFVLRDWVWEEKNYTNIFLQRKQKYHLDKLYYQSAASFKKGIICEITAKGKGRYYMDEFIIDYMEYQKKRYAKMLKDLHKYNTTLVPTISAYSNNSMYGKTF